MVCIEDLPQKYKLHVMGSDRYSIRDTQIHDDVAGRFVTADDIIENMGDMGSVWNMNCRYTNRTYTDTERILRKTEPIIR